MVGQLRDHAEMTSPAARVRQFDRLCAENLNRIDDAMELAKLAK
jgi:hypothetical protein